MAFPPLALAYPRPDGHKSATPNHTHQSAAKISCLLSIVGGKPALRVHHVKTGRSTRLTESERSASAQSDPPPPFPPLSGNKAEEHRNAHNFGFGWRTGSARKTRPLHTTYQRVQEGPLPKGVFPSQKPSLALSRTYAPQDDKIASTTTVPRLTS